MTTALQRLFAPPTPTLLNHKRVRFTPGDIRGLTRLITAARADGYRTLIVHHQDHTLEVRPR